MFTIPLFGLGYITNLDFSSTLGLAKDVTGMHDDSVLHAPIVTTTAYEPIAVGVYDCPFSPTNIVAGH
ncbi:hypothetical protein [Flavobacterium chungangense]|uniref:hypothetical protein n=1 Tax=Flavobacterium chungangense TaxID=554283 RepID=UPI0004DF1EB4|nr:hypothetical protein [Flavobacterium chungangense]